MTLRILLAEDCAALRASVRALLEHDDFHVVGEAADGAQAVALASRLDPDVVILDLSMPRVNGIEAARQIHEMCPDALLIALTRHTAPAYVAWAMRNGIRGYVTKTSAPEDLVAAIHVVSRGGTFISHTAAGVLRDE
jgi:DNA-binding NarL/FixJ family response regulator